MSIGSHPAAEPEAPDHPAADAFDLEPVLDRAMEAMRQKAVQLGQATKTMRAKYYEDTITLDGCVAKTCATTA